LLGGEAVGAGKPDPPHKNLKQKWRLEHWAIKDGDHSSILKRHQYRPMIVCPAFPDLSWRRVNTGNWRKDVRSRKILAVCVKATSSRKSASSVPPLWAKHDPHLGQRHSRQNAFRCCFVERYWTVERSV